MSDGEFDMGALLEQALAMQHQIAQAQAEVAQQSVEGGAAGGKVRVTMTGSGDVISVRIDKTLVDPDEVEMLEDLIVAGIHDAQAKAVHLAQRAMGPLAGGLGGLGGMLGT